MMKCLQAETGAGIVFFPDGEICVENVKEFSEKVLLEAGNSSSVTIDLHDVRFIDSAGVGAILSLMRNFEERGARFFVRRLNPLLKISLANFLKIECGF